MVQLLESDVRTRDVLRWKGLHVFHFPTSSCSQKLRIFLNLKGIEWASHVVNLLVNENLSPYFLGINPRGLIPVIVHDGAVHIESNDILLYLEQRFPAPSLAPVASAAELKALLRHEDELHLDLRLVTLRFIVDPSTPIKSPRDLERYATAGSGTVLGQRDAGLQREIAFWRALDENEITTAAAQAAVRRFRAAFEELDERLRDSDWLLGDSLSILDIAWTIYVERLRLAGYPISRLHPRLGQWFAQQVARPEFAREMALPADIAKIFATKREELQRRGASLEQVCHFD
jgi:glutathione S-transferase